MKEYFRPLVQLSPKRPENALPICGTNLWFKEVEVITRARSLGFKKVESFPSALFKNITKKRSPIGGIDFLRPEIMGVINLTPDSFSDGGIIKTAKDFRDRMKNLLREGATIIDIGGESTRPGSEEVSYAEEMNRILPALKSLPDFKNRILVSIDTRKSQIANLASKFHFQIINDVSAGSFDKNMLDVVKKFNLNICLCHSRGTPKNMNKNRWYKNVVLDVYDDLEDKIKKAMEVGISRDKILIDPGIGFGKTGQHNIGILRNISIFHDLGCPIVLGVSRKKFIKTITEARSNSDLEIGSVFFALEGIRQGVQVVRVHDVRLTKMCLKAHQVLWN